MTTADSSPSYVLTLRAVPDANGVPVVIRFRRVLKYAGRVCGLRCVAIRPADDQQAQQAPPSDPAAGGDDRGRGDDQPVEAAGR